MIDFWGFDPVLVALIALTPGIAAWWTGRRLAAAAEDPALPELLFARQQTLSKYLAAALAVAVVVGGTSVYWALPLMAVGVAIGGFPLRRALRIESGSLLGSLWRSAKSILGGLGFWILLAWTPDIVLAIPPRYRVASIALLVVLVLWETFYHRIWLWLHEATPLRDVALDGRIAMIVERAGVPAPAVYRVGGEGARFMNAIALPSARTPRIGLGNALIELLEPDEVAAIYAHELAHIEHFSPRVVRRLQSWTWLLIAVAIALPLVAAWLAPHLAHWVAIVWPVVVLAYLLLRARKSQQHETESDLRAAALCGDPEIVVRALVKLHVHAFVPRRWAVDFERGATHPSLARRIQALRGQGSAAVTSLGAPTVLATAREGSVVVFDDARAYWFDGVPEGTSPALESLRVGASSARSVAWSELIELRVTTLGSERALRATHRNGDSWSVPLAPEHIADVQKALDVVDVRLRRELGKRPPVALHLVPVVTLFGMFMSGQIGILMIPVLLALVRPSTAALAALGAMAVGRAALAAALGEQPLFGTAPIGIPALAAAGALALWVAWRRTRKEAKRDGGRLTFGVLIGVAIALAVSLASTLPSVPVAQALDVPVVPALATTLLGIAAVAFFTGSSTARVGGTIAGAAGLLLGLMKFGAVRVGDVNSALSHTTRRAVPVGELNLGANVNGLQLSPNGTRFAIGQHAEYDGSRGRAGVMPKYVLGAVGGPRRDVNALQLEFVDDERVLLLRLAEQRYVLSLEQVDSALAIWTEELPDVYEPRLTVSRGDRRWMVVGDDETSDTLLILTGDAAAPGAVTRRVAKPDSLGILTPLVFDDGATLVFSTVEIPSRSVLPLLMFSMYWPRTQLVRVHDSVRQTLGSMDGFPQCGSEERDRAICFVRLRRGASVWSVAASGAMRREATLSIRDPIVGTPGPGPIITVTSHPDHVTVIDLESSRLIDLTVPTAPGVMTEARASGGQLAVIRQDNRGARLYLYKID